MPKPLDLFSAKGCIVDFPCEAQPPEIIDYINRNNEFTSFLVGDVFSFNGNDNYTIVTVNRISPIWHFILMPYKDFLEVVC